MATGITQSFPSAKNNDQVIFTCFLTGHDAVVDGALADGYFALLKPVAPDVLASVLNERLNRG